jgi:FKBP-type peptidyl-prolyl cis-trans isomerase
LTARWFPVVVFLVVALNGTILLIPSCKSSNEKTLQKDPKNMQEGLIRNQQQIIRDEALEIDAYISRRNYTMSTTETGLRYQIYFRGPGTRLADNEDVVKLNYSVSLLDGTSVYNSDSTGVLQFKVGKSDIAGGLQEGVRLMHEGDKAIFILPAHLGYGLTGDGDQIKHYATLVINAELLQINSGQ